MLQFFGFSSTVTCNVTFDDAESRKRVGILKPANAASPVDRETFYLFTSGDSIRGQIVFTTDGKRVEYTEVKCELIGQVIVENDSREQLEFTSLSQTLSGPGSFEDTQVFDYAFENVDKQYESFWGTTAQLRYFIRATMVRSYSPNIVEEQEFWVQNITQESEINHSIKMEVGIEDCLHIEFEYNKAKYHLNDVVIGKVFFLLVKIKIRHMELAIIRRETTGQGASMYNESDTVAKFEIMDGAPIKGESIPVRLFLGCFRLTPTYIHICNKFSVKYFINLVLVDDEDRRYYKQQEIFLWRKHL
eukprot:NODE_1085_length_1114_cov_258.199061_g832_i0.p1 GENE.NODE_1085_length_1114_cov_258.199061_g832_i0~~NODE_1085_length_1114_cov_258.199061_g832_i0.p1  ORF type:complete len:303 (+),score=50.96 NODE_1085_length_1114_cov_258.199061_g832_i0:97-1005(+)